MCDTFPRQGHKNTLRLRDLCLMSIEAAGSNPGASMFDLIILLILLLWAWRENMLNSTNLSPQFCNYWCLLQLTMQKCNISLLYFTDKFLNFNLYVCVSNPHVFAILKEFLSRGPSNNFLGFNLLIDNLCWNIINVTWYRYFRNGLCTMFCLMPYS